MKSAEPSTTASPAAPTPNFARLLTSLSSYAYAQGDDELVVHLALGGTARFETSDNVG